MPLASDSFSLNFGEVTVVVFVSIVIAVLSGFLVDILVNSLSGDDTALVSMIVHATGGLLFGAIMIALGFLMRNMYAKELKEAYINTKNVHSAKIRVWSIIIVTMSFGIPACVHFIRAGTWIFVVDQIIGIPILVTEVVIGLTLALVFAFNFSTSALLTFASVVDNEDKNQNEEEIDTETEPLTNTGVKLVKLQAPSSWF